ncbi:MAG: prepilin-type N-terminal cleavage/methylation domain-containing protein [Candidatus Hydrogenedentes bacterium]|nr:prepilin-type N-terminal cleavage/methylation domain-containing protein [Candidatus Hydrogenedentota bacterium]
MKRQHGFTMVELMIVIEIIIILTALAYPQLRRALINAREGSAVGSVKMIVTGQSGFKEAGFADADANGEGDYATFPQLVNPDGSGTTAPFVDQDLGSGIKSGYIFTISVTAGSAGTPPSYTVTAVPTIPGTSAYKMFYADESGIIRVSSDGSPVGPSSPPI